MSSLQLIEDMFYRTQGNDSKNNSLTIQLYNFCVIVCSHVSST